MLNITQHTVFTTRWEEIGNLIIPDYHRKHQIEGRKDLLEYSLKQYKQLRAIHINMHPDRKYNIIDGVETFLVLKATGKKEIVVQDHFFDENAEMEASVILNNQVSHYSEDQILKYIDQSFDEFMKVKPSENVKHNTGIPLPKSSSKSKEVTENIGHINIALTNSLKADLVKIIADNGYVNYPGLMKKVVEFHKNGGAL